MRYGLVAIVLILAAATVSAQPQVYRWVDANGVVHFSDSRPPPSESVEPETVVVSDTPTRFETVRPSDRSPVLAREDDATTADSARPAIPAPARAQGHECFASSPLKEDGRDLYERSGPPEPLTSEETELYLEVLRDMSGHWSGKETRSACEGRPGSEAKTQSDRDITSDGRLGSPDNLAFTSTLSPRSSADSTWSTDRWERLTRLALRDGRLRVNNSDAALFAVSDRTLEFGYILQVGGLVNEHYWRIATDRGRSLVIELVTYQQGAWGSSTTWNLRR